MEEVICFSCFHATFWYTCSLLWFELPITGTGTQIALCAGNLRLEAFATSVGEGRGRDKAAGGPRAPLGCSSARVHRPAAPAAEPPLHLRLAVRTCRGAAPASPPLQPSAVRSPHPHVTQSPARTCLSARFESPLSPIRTCPSP
jgi:hypothetical protein